jgi:hypothetical protein
MKWKTNNSTQFFKTVPKSDLKITETEAKIDISNSHIKLFKITNKMKNKNYHSVSNSSQKLPQR